MKILLALDGKYPSDANMERDLELFNKVKSGELEGVLRIYNWSVPAITTGYHQNNFKCSDETVSLPVYKRPTGGGAVLHFDDITYSISLQDKFFGKDNSLNDSYVELSKLFQKALNQCGYPVIMQGSSSGFSKICFARSAPVELVLNGHKVMGAAQLRSEGFLLQQGVIPVRADNPLNEKVFGKEYRGFGLDEFKPFDRDEFIDKLLKNIKDEFAIWYS